VIWEAALSISRSGEWSIADDAAALAIDEGVELATAQEQAEERT
jgi:hypothetical protein